MKLPRMVTGSGSAATRGVARRLAFAALAAALALAACGSRPAAPAAPLSNTPARPLAADGPAPAVRDGALWTCTIDDYPSQPCRFDRAGDGTWTLRKLLGSQRFDGETRFDPDGSFHLHGELFCPWGDCDEEIDTRFEPAADAAYHGDLNGTPVRVEWNPANAAAYGGAGYGHLTGKEQ